MTHYVKLTGYVRKDGRTIKAEIRLETDDVPPGEVGIQAHGYSTGNEITGQMMLDLKGVHELRDALNSVIEEREKDA